MAADFSAQERSEPATPHRRRKAHEEGRVARSADLSGAAVLLGGIGGLALMGGTLALRLVETFRSTLPLLSSATLDQPNAIDLIYGVARAALPVLVGLLLAATLPALLLNALQARGVFSLEPLKPKWSHLSPLGNLKRILGAQAVAALVKALLKLLVLAAIVYVALRSVWPELIGLGSTTVERIPAVTWNAGLRLALAAGLAFLAIAAADYGFQFYQLEKQLRMTRQEVVQERKEQEGDPLIKSRIQSVARALARKRMLGEVKRADVVITNPSHIAVALKYDPAMASAPVVLAMGERKLAERIKEIARAAGVPLVENRPLARALLSTARVGQAIPPALYAAVAEVLAYVYRTRGTLPSVLARSQRRLS
jgi:flagellar biosynthetic protein FlhB